MSFGTDTGSGGKRVSSSGVAMSAHESVAHEGVMDSSLSHNLDIAPPKTGKFCCVCGRNVAGEERFKDKLGRYWCYDCGKADSEKKHANDLVNCQDCGQPQKRGDLMEFEQLKLCEHCHKKRVWAAKREKARIAAAEQEAREAEQRKHRLMIAAIVGGALVAVGGIWMVMF
jgi:NMD protein affecting ribosome stability and mRNA decay